MYTDGDLDDDDIEGKRSYKIEDKIANNRHNRDYVRKLHGEGKKQNDFISQFLFCSCVPLDLFLRYLVHSVQLTFDGKFM